MSKQLSIQNATITTAAVEVKTLTISGKQVTLAVFRQLREEPLVAEDGTLNGAPWGIVNYHPDKCTSTYTPHWHIVWQHGTELRRARVNHAAPFDKGGQDELGYVRDRASDIAPESSSPLLSSLVLSWLNGQREKCPLPVEESRWEPKVGGVACWSSGHGFTVLATASDAAREAAIARTRLRASEAATAKATEELAEANSGDASIWRLKAAQSELDRAQGVEKEDRCRDVNTHDALAAEVAGYGLEPSASYDAWRADVDAEVARREQYRDVLTKLAELPQLFIAV